MNGMCANYDLQLSYSKIALELARQINNKKWIPLAYYRMGIAYLDCGKEDSALLMDWRQVLWSVLKGERELVF